MLRMGHWRQTSGVLTALFCTVSAVAVAGVRVQFEGPDGLAETVLVSGTTYASATLPGALALPAAAMITPTIVPLASVLGDDEVSDAVSATAAGRETEILTLPLRTNVQKTACVQALKLVQRMGALGAAGGGDKDFLAVVSEAAMLEIAVLNDEPGALKPLERAFKRVGRNEKLKDEMGQAITYATSLCAVREAPVKVEMLRPR